MLLAVYGLHENNQFKDHQTVEAVGRQIRRLAITFSAARSIDNAARLTGAHRGKTVRQMYTNISPHKKVRVKDAEYRARQIQLSRKTILRIT